MTRTILQFTVGDMDIVTVFKIYTGNAPAVNTIAADRDIMGTV